MPDYEDAWDDGYAHGKRDAGADSPCTHLHMEPSEYARLTNEGGKEESNGFTGMSILQTTL